MSIDTQLRRHFRPLVVLMVAAAAYFQAVGLASLVRIRLAARALPNSTPVAAALMAPVPKAPQPAELAEAAARAFDSTPPAPKTTPAPTATTTGGPSREPLTDPTCDFAWVVLIAAAEKETGSLAVVRQKSGPGEVRRVGDDVGTHTVWHIAPQRVWLASPSARCQMRLGEAPRAKEPVGRSSRRARAARARTTRRGGRR